MTARFSGLSKVSAWLFVAGAVGLAACSLSNPGLISDSGTGSSDASPDGTLGPNGSDAGDDANANPTDNDGGPESDSTGNDEVGDSGLGPDVEGGGCTGLACDGGCFKVDDVNNCGACGNDCAALPHIAVGGATCQSSKCGVTASGCAAGWADCNGDPSDGCETDITTAQHCGSCTVACSGGTPVCSSASGTRSCASGCSTPSPTPCGSSCVNLTSDPNNCAACGHVCSGGTTCQSSVCACPSGSHLCGSTCSSNMSTNSCGTTSCSACAIPANGSATCDGTQCGESCPGSLLLCGSGSSATCVNSQSDSSNCGACGKTCTGGMTCQSSNCACSSGTHACSGQCSSNTSTASCGTTSCSACPVPANGTATCNGTACGASCSSPLSVCGSGSSVTCLNLQTDPNNCGTCGHVCPSSMSCTSGTCACPNGTHLCGSTCSSNTSLNSCGTTSCTACPVPSGGGVATCDGTQCILGCSTFQPLSLCGSGTTAYCANLTDDPNNCGSCGHVCPGDTNGVGTAVCSGSTCGISCPSGYAECVPGACYSEC